MQHDIEESAKVSNVTMHWLKLVISKYGHPEPPGNIEPNDLPKMSEDVFCVIGIHFPTVPNLICHEIVTKKGMLLTFMMSIERVMLL